MAPLASLIFDGRVNDPDLRPPDGWRVDGTSDNAAIASQVLRYADAALAWARSRADDVEAALDDLLDSTTPRDVSAAIALLRRTSPSDPRLPELVERRTLAFIADPRPIWLRPHLVTWRSDAGLPERDDLPTFYTSSMLPHVVAQYGSPQAAYLANGSRGVFYFADGRQTTTPPPGWLE